MAHLKIDMNMKKVVKFYDSKSTISLFMGIIFNQ